MALSEARHGRRLVFPHRRAQGAWRAFFHRGDLDHDARLRRRPHADATARRFRRSTMSSTDLPLSTPTMTRRVRPSTRRGRPICRAASISGGTFSISSAVTRLNSSRRRAFLTYPQYFAWRLGGAMASEATSLGAHTDLWRPNEGDLSSMVDTLGWRRLFPPMRKAWDTLGTLKPEVAACDRLVARCAHHLRRARFERLPRAASPIAGASRSP